MSDKALAQAQDIAKKITDALGGYGIFGVEMFICGDDVLFSEVSPRPHDTGMVTMISQDIETFSYNTSISAFMICVNELSQQKCKNKELLKT